METIGQNNKKEIGEGLRFNKGKDRYDLVEPWSHEQMVKVLTLGAKKYEERNWQKGRISERKIWRGIQASW